ncbi:MAG: starch-binding protein, partial [Ruminococcus sp.]|nr:starch-binding protein [Ruminococcus sp.]
KDATIIQKYLAKYENLGYPVGEAIPGTGEWVTLPVTTPATTVTVAPSTTKATEASTTAEPTEVITTTEPTTAELTTTETTTEPTTAEPVITEPSEIVTDPYEDPTDPPVYGEAKTVYFSNNKFWQGEVYAYIWDANDYKPAEWPGLPMTFVKTNDYGESIFSVEVPAGMTYIIFTDGSSQSVDIDLTLESQNGFYLTDADAEGKYAYGTYDFV